MLIDTIIVDPEDIRAVVKARMPAVIEIAILNELSPLAALGDILRASTMSVQDINKAMDAALEYLFDHRRELPWDISPPKTMRSWRTSE